MGLFDVFTSTNSDAARDAQVTGLNKGNALGQADLSAGLDAAQGSYAAGIAPFTQNYATASGGQNAYADATGANGSQGYGRAVNNFQTSPGYQFQVDQATENALRSMGRTGQTGGGTVDLAKQVEGLANTQWQSYVQNLLPFLGASNSAATGIQTGNNAQAATQNANYTTRANMDYGTQAGIGNAEASAQLAKNSESANAINLGMQGAKLVAGFL